MFDIDKLIEDCIRAAKDGDGILAVRDVLERAVRDPSLVSALPAAHAEVVPLHSSDEVTVLKVVWAPGMTFPAHDHRMWAAIGVYGGEETNTFYRRTPGGLTQTGGQQLRAKDVLLLGDDAIHTVSNPTDRFTGAIHVYGGPFLATPRSEWDPDTREERPYDLQAALRYFESQNAQLA
jgi:predicted metal-dependent enzyme (double-stranded beta helix superfamily)